MKKLEDEGLDLVKVKVMVVVVVFVDVKKVFVVMEVIVDGVVLVCDFVNELVNIFGLLEFMEYVVVFGKFGVSVEVLNEKDMKKFGMGVFFVVG